MKTPTSECETEMQYAEDIAMEAALKQLCPAPLPDHVEERWISSMDARYGEEVEERLRTVHSAPVNEFTLMKWTRAMDKAAQSVDKTIVPKKRTGYGWLTWSASAAAVVTVMGGALAILLQDGGDMGGGVPAPLTASDLNRSAVGVVDKGIKWDGEAGMAMQNYDVYIEDSVNMVDAEGNQIQVTVPSKKEIELPVDIY